VRGGEELLDDLRWLDEKEETSPFLGLL